MPFGLKDEIVARIHSVFSKFPEIEKALVYGSRAKGNFKSGSDIDLTLLGANIDLKTLNRIELAIDELMLPWTFDISIFNHLDNPDLIDHIKRVGEVFYDAKQLKA